MSRLKKCQQCQPGHKSAPCRLPEILRPTLLCPCAPWASGHWEIYNWEIIENNNWRSLGGYEQALWWTRWLHACPSSLMISFHDKEEDWMFVCVNLSLLHLTVFTSLAAPRPRDQSRTFRISCIFRTHLVQVLCGSSWWSKLHGGYNWNLNFEVAILPVYTVLSCHECY